MHTALLLDMAADFAPDRLAFGSREEGLSYAEVRRRARQGAAYLESPDGTAVAFVGLNGIALPLALFASGLLSKPFVPLNYRLPNTDLNRLIARTAPATVIADDGMLGRIEPHPGITVVSRSAFEARCSEPGEPARDFLGVDHDIAVLLFTSGTTGEPKAAVLRHANLTAYVISTVEFMGSEPDEAALVSVPPYHIAGISAILTGIYSGRRVVQMDAFTPESWVDAAAAQAITHTMVVPTMLGRILDVLEARDETLPALRALSYGGGRMPQPVIERAMARMPHLDFVNAYGLIAILSPEDHREAMSSADPLIRRRLASVGRPLSSVELEIRDPDGRTLGPGEPGEIYVRGEQVSGEYTHKKILDAEGWFATNDGGWLDDDGYLFVEGRLDDVIVRGGENISPGEIEDLLREHPAVADVAVLGLPDDEWGEVVACAIIPRGPTPDAADLAVWVKSRLRSTKTPEVWAFLDVLPYNDTGKLLRRQLKAKMNDAGRRPMRV